MRALVLTGLALLGCATQSVEKRQEDPSVSPVIGAPDDFKTRPGQYDGYDVVQCGDRSCGGVVGTGRNWPPGMERGPEYPDDVYQKSFQSFRAELMAALRRVAPSVDISALSRRCGANDIETVVWLHSWRELDVALASAGRFLKARDLKEKISVCVMTYSPAVED
jgi:hypothetical protein